MARAIVWGISGKIGAGKDTAAKFLVEHYNATIVRFSEALKEEVLHTMPRTIKAIAAMNRLRADTEEELRKIIWDVKPQGVRELLQEWGTELRRSEDPNYWTNKWLESVEDLLKGGTRFIVAPDTRFLNELNAIGVFNDYALTDVAGVDVEVSASTIRVVREPAHEAGEHIFEGAPLNLHSSETQLDGIDLPTFRNYGSIEELHEMLDAYMTGIL